MLHPSTLQLFWVVPIQVVPVHYLIHTVHLDLIILVKETFLFSNIFSYFQDRSLKRQHMNYRQANCYSSLKVLRAINCRGGGQYRQCSQCNGRPKLAILISEDVAETRVRLGFLKWPWHINSSGGAQCSPLMYGLRNTGESADFLSG